MKLWLGPHRKVALSRRIVLMTPRFRFLGILGISVMATILATGCVPKSSTVVEPVKQSTENTSEQESDVTGPESTESPGGANGANTTLNSPPTNPGAEATANPDVPAPADGTESPSNPNPASGGGAVTLRLTMNKGAEMKYQSTSETKSPMMGGMGGGEAKPLVTSTDTVVKVIDVNNGKSKVEMTVAKINMKGGNTAEDNKQLQKAATDAQGVKVSAFFDSMGKPSDLKYLKGTRMQAMAAGIDSDTGFFGLTYPENAVKPGDKWTHKFDFKDAIGAYGPMSNANWKDSMITTVFTLQSVDVAKGIAVISISSSGNPSMSMKMPDFGKSDKGANMPKEMKMNFKINGSGTAFVNIKTGIPNEIKYEMNQSFSNPMGGKDMTQSTKASLKKTS